MTHRPDGNRTTPGATDPVQAEAVAERLMAGYRLAQSAETRHAGRDRSASRWIVVAGMTLFGTLAGAVMGATRGHAVAGALAMAPVGALLAIVGQRRS